MTYYWHKHMFLCLRHNAINITLFVGSSDLYLEDEDEEFGRFNGQHEYIVRESHVSICTFSMLHNKYICQRGYIFDLVSLLRFALTLISTTRASDSNGRRLK